MKKTGKTPRHAIHAAPAYDALKEELVLTSAVIDVRNRAGITQEQLARKIGTNTACRRQLESGRSRPSMCTLQRLVDASG